MQDRFKFRIWNGAEMHYNDFVVTATGYVGKITEEFLGKCVFNQEDLTADKECVLMQSTGLKDKNGKLIYEGDIVNVYVFSKKLYRYQVKFEIGSFMLVSNDEMFDFPNKWNDNVYPLSQLYFEYENEDYYINQLEIIGNIYENYDLLEVEK